MLNIRYANAEDCELIVKFINELAEFEKLSQDVVVDAEMIKRNLFTENPNIFSLIANFDGIDVGFVLFFFNFSTFLGKRGLYIEDLYVSPEFRGKGIGKTLLKQCAKIAVEKGCGRMEWSVLEWNPAVEFYKSLNAKILDDWRICRLTGDDLINLVK